MNIRVTRTALAGVLVTSLGWALAATPISASTSAPSASVEDCFANGAKKEWVGLKLVDGPAQGPDELSTSQLPDHSRVLRPGDVTTLDFNPMRTTIRVNDNDVIQDVRCG